MGLGNDGDVDLVTHQIRRQMLDSARLDDGRSVQDVQRRHIVSEVLMLWSDVPEVGFATSTRTLWRDAGSVVHRRRPTTTVITEMLDGDGDGRGVQDVQRRCRRSLSTHLPDCLYRVSFRRYRPLHLQLNCEVVEKRCFGWGVRTISPWTGTPPGQLPPDNSPILTLLLLSGDGHFG